MKSHNRTARRIAEVALRLLEQEGPEKVTMRRVAKAVGITPMAMYHHFPDRKAMLKAVTDREFAKLAGFVEDRWGAGMPNSRLVNLGESAFACFCSRRPSRPDSALVRTARRGPGSPST